MIDVLELPEPLYEQLTREARSAFPRECCGLVEGICEDLQQIPLTLKHAKPVIPGASLAGDDISDTISAESAVAARATAVHPMPNLAMEPDRFEIDPSAHIALLRRLRSTGRQIIGCYHSHPNGRPEPSARDLAGAGETSFLWLIAAIERPSGEFRLACFVWTGTAFAPVQLANFPLPHERGGEG